jgi:hypothetical protein
MIVFDFVLQHSKSNAVNDPVPFRMMSSWAPKMIVSFERRYRQKTKTLRNA